MRTYSPVSCLVLLISLFTIVHLEAQSMGAAPRPIQRPTVDLGAVANQLGSIGSNQLGDAPQATAGNPNTQVQVQAQAGGSAHLSSATLPPGPNAPSQVELAIRGQGLTSSMFLGLVGPDVNPGPFALHVLANGDAFAIVDFAKPLNLEASYKAFLFADDKGKNVLSIVTLDLQYIGKYEPTKPVASKTSATGGHSRDQDQARKTRQEADRIDRQTKADLRLATSKAKAEAVRQELYLQDHPDIAPSTGSVFGGQAEQGPQASNLYCQRDSAAETAFIHVRRSVVDPKEASDSYGRRLGRRFIVFEITVENTNPSLQYILHDVSVDLSQLHHLPAGTYQWAFSSQDLIMLRGVPEKGSDLDPRNLTFHLARAVGTVAGGASGIVATGVQDIYAGATAAFNGPLLSSFLDVFPDHTATQLNRLSDSAFTANVVVAKQSAKTFAIFVPEGLFMTKAEQNAYWREPLSVFTTPTLDFRQADVCVDGAFITEVTPLSLASVIYDKPQEVTAGASVAVTVTGANLAAGDAMLDVFGQSVPLTAVTTDGTGGHATIKIPTPWNSQLDEPAAIESKKSGQKTPAVPLRAPETPVLTKTVFAAGATLGKGNDVVLQVTGLRLVAGDTELVFSGNELMLTDVTDGAAADVKIKLPDDYKSTTSYPILLKSKRTGLLSQPSILPTSAPPTSAP